MMGGAYMENGAEGDRRKRGGRPSWRLPTRFSWTALKSVIKKIEI